MKTELRREIAALDELFAWVDQFAASAGLREKDVFDAKLAAEELFTNMVKHNPRGRDRITVSLDRDGDRLVLRVRDDDVDRFDGSLVTPVDLKHHLGNHEIGGLGLHLVRSVMDRLSFEHEAGVLSVTAVKELEGEDV